MKIRFYLPRNSFVRIHSKIKNKCFQFESEAIKDSLLENHISNIYSYKAQYVYPRLYADSILISISFHILLCVSFTKNPRDGVDSFSHDRWRYVNIIFSLGEANDMHWNI